MIVGVFDYGAGNLHSLVKAIEGPSVTVRIECDADAATRHDALVLPGVGAFAAATSALGDAGRARMAARIRDGLPTLGICLGMQLLFDRSEEGGGAGLGIVAGEVRRLRAQRVPQIGWNRIDAAVPDPLLQASGLDTAYFANSFVCAPDDPARIVAWSTHESDRYACIVRESRCVGVQFHPEKSSASGVAFVHAWLREVRS